MRILPASYLHPWTHALNQDQAVDWYNDVKNHILAGLRDGFRGNPSSRPGAEKSVSEFLMLKLQDYIHNGAFKPSNVVSTRRQSKSKPCGLHAAFQRTHTALSFTLAGKDQGAVFEEAEVRVLVTVGSSAEVIASSTGMGSALVDFTQHNKHDMATRKAKARAKAAASRQILGDAAFWQALTNEFNFSILLDRVLAWEDNIINPPPLSLPHPQQYDVDRPATVLLDELLTCFGNSVVSAYVTRSRERTRYAKADNRSASIAHDGYGATLQLKATSSMGISQEYRFTTHLVWFGRSCDAIRAVATVALQKGLRESLESFLDKSVPGSWPLDPLPSEALSPLFNQLADSLALSTSVQHQAAAAQQAVASSSRPSSSSPMSIDTPAPSTSLKGASAFPKRKPPTSATSLVTKRAKVPPEITPVAHAARMVHCLSLTCQWLYELDNKECLFPQEAFIGDEYRLDRGRKVNPVSTWQECDRVDRLYLACRDVQCEMEYYLKCPSRLTLQWKVLQGGGLSLKIPDHMLERFHQELTSLGEPGQTLFGTVLLGETLYSDCTAGLEEEACRPLLRLHALEVVKGRSQTASAFLPDVLRNLDGLTDLKVTMRMPQMLGSDWSVFAPSLGRTLRRLHLANQSIWTLWALSTVLEACQTLIIEDCLGSTPTSGYAQTWHLPKSISWDTCYSLAPLTHLYIKTSPTFSQEWHYNLHEVERLFGTLFETRKVTRHVPGAMEVDEYDDEDWDDDDEDFAGMVPMQTQTIGVTDWTLQEVRALDARSNRFLGPLRSAIRLKGESRNDVGRVHGVLPRIYHCGD